MKKFIFLFLWSCTQLHLNSKMEAKKAATMWFYQLDNGFYAKVYGDSSSYLRDRLRKGRMKQMLDTRLLLLGKNKSRLLKGENVLKKYSGLGRGEFFVFDYISDFELRSAVQERVVLKKDASKWKVFDYFMF